MASFDLIYFCDGCKQKVPPQSHNEKIRTMPCFHTLCNTCILEACKTGKPRCPSCKKGWDIEQMRRFTCCSVCKYFRKQAVAHCLDCKKDMCTDCEKKHMDNTLGAEHQVLAINQQFGTEISNKIREAGLDTEENRFKKADLSSHEGVLDAPNRGLDNTDMNLPGVTCTSKLQMDTTDVFSLMRDKQTIVDTMIEDTESQLSFFSDIMAANPDLRDSMAESMDNLVQDSIDQVQNVVANNPWDQNVQYEICVTGKPMDTAAQPEINVKTKTMPHLNFKDIPYHRFRLKSSTPVEGNARRVYRCHNRVLVSTWDCFFIYTLDCQFLGRFLWSHEFETSAAVPIQSSVWVIADYEQGLYMITKEGKLTQKLCSGCFSDVDAYDDRLYALEYKERIVKIYQFEVKTQQWVPIQEVSLKYDNVSSGDTVRAYKERLHVCSALNHCVYIYNVDSCKYRRVGKYGKVTVNPNEGVLFYPRICMADYFGNTLVADSWNKRLMVLHDDDTWARVNLQGEEGEVWDVFLEQGLKNIWAISFIEGEYRLLHFVSDL